MRFMSPHRPTFFNRRSRAALAAGVLALALGAGPLTVATATALPAPAAPSPNFPDPGAPGGGQQKKDERLEKGERLGGGIITKMIDSMADTVKCILNIPLPTVKCG